MYMNANEFDLDFDFEKEYGFDPPKEEPVAQTDEDFDLRAILESDFDEEAALFNSEYQNDFDYGPDEFPLEEEPAPEDADEPAAEDDFSFEGLNLDIPADDIPLSLDFDPVEQPEVTMEEMPEEEPEEKSSRRRRERKNPLRERPAPEAETSSATNSRRRPVSRMRQFKNETLPLIIMGITALLIVIFVIGSITRAITTHIQNTRDQQSASESRMNEEQRQQKEAEDLMAEAAVLAAGYDYEAAIAKLETYSGGASNHTDISIRISEYKQAMNTLIEFNDPGAIPNLSFHMLIADPSRAFTDQAWGGSYNKNFVTVDEFQKILEQLYENGYVLVEMDDFIAETVTGDTVTYSSKPLALPDGKKPIMITETMVNYFYYMIDGNDDGTPDKDGAGFASRLVIDSLTGDIKAEMVNSAGETVVGNYDLVPILEDFIEEHPDFSYRGARATLAVTGYEGIFGYRINSSVINSKGQEYYDEQVAGAKAIVAALREKGYELACYTYSNTDYGTKNASDIQADLASWNTEIVPVIGAVDTLVYARSSDISTTGNYTGGKYNVLYQAGFRYFITNGSVPSAEVTANYVRQKRIMVTGTQMAHTSAMYSSYFDAKTVLNSLRGNVPQ